jgi:hypothetical protein
VEIANLAQQTNENFVQSFVLTDWSALYDFTIGGFRSHLRDVISDSVSLYEWASPGVDPSAHGLITYSATLANGFVTYTINPVATDTLQLGSSIITFVTSGAVGNQVNLGLSRALTMTALLNFLASSADPQISLCTYSVSGGSVLNVTYKTVSTLGNTFTIAASSSGATTSADTLTGGGGLLTMSAPISDLEELNGVYFYDVRYENPPTYAVLFGGTITFTQGVTRDATT